MFLQVDSAVAYFYFFFILIDRGFSALKINDALNNLVQTQLKEDFFKSLIDNSSFDGFNKSLASFQKKLLRLRNQECENTFSLTDYVNSNDSKWAQIVTCNELSSSSNALLIANNLNRMVQFIV